MEHSFINWIIMGYEALLKKWFHSYLSGQCQTTQADGKILKKEKVVCGVPQGSVLGPLLFLLYINDIQTSSKKFDFFLFADDTNLIVADKNSKSLESIVNTELDNVCGWLLANKLSLNIDKSNFVIFHPYRGKTKIDIHLKLFDNENKTMKKLERKSFVKCLGVMIDNNLPWKFHVDYIALGIIYNYPPKGRWIVVDIYRDAKRRGIYPPLLTDPEGESCFSIYQIRWIKKCCFNFLFWNFRETTRHFSFRSQSSE